MIEVLTGQRETVIYDKNIPLRMHLNIDAEDFPLHWQNSFEIIMPLESNYLLHVEDRTENLVPGDIIMMSPGILHSITAPAAGSRYILLVNKSFFSHVAGLEQIAARFYPYTLFTNTSNAAFKDAIGELLNTIWQEYSSQEPLKYAALYSSVFSLFVLAGRNSTKPFFSNAISHNPQTHKYTEQFNALCTYIDEHCAENISLSELALSLGFSDSHFNRLFRQFAGVSCFEFLNHSRITLAKTLLTTQGGMTIVDIALQCGFSSLSTFNRTFKAITKITPSEFRNLQGSV